MGCASSAAKNANLPLSELSLAPSFYPRQTRIIQEEEVDMCINDEYDVEDKDWLHWDQNCHMMEEEGEWVSGESAGGSRNDLELFSTNPQYLLSLGPPEKHPNPNVHPYLVTEPPKEEALPVSICLTQKGDGPPYHVAFFIYKTEDKSESLGAEYFLLVPPTGDTGAFVNWRQLRHEFKLHPGLYVVIPATFTPDLSRKFTITVHSHPPFTFGRLNVPKI